MRRRRRCLRSRGEWKERFDQLQASTPGQERTSPVIILVCDNTDMAEHFHKRISGEMLAKMAEADDEEDEARIPGDRWFAKKTKEEVEDEKAL